MTLFSDPAKAPYFFRSLFSEWLIVTALAAAFVFMQIASPGFEINLAEGLRKDQHLAPLVLMEAKETSIWRMFWDGRLPTRRDGYHGTLMAYLYMPFYAFMGPDWRLIKFWQLLFAVPGLLLIYLFTKELFDKTTALWGLLLLVIHPNFEGGVRVGEIMHGYLLFFAGAPLFCLAKWWNTKNMGWYYAGLFLLGLGMTTQFWYFWLITGLVVVALFYPSNFFNLLTSKGFRWIFYSVVCFFSGAALFVYHELFHPLKTLRALWGRWEMSTGDSSYLERLTEMVRYINSNFSSLEFQMLDALTPLVSGNRLFPFALWGSVAWLFWRGWRSSRDRRLWIFPTILLTMILLAAVQGLVRVHLFFLYPFPALILAVAGVEVFRAASDRRGLRILFGVASLVFLAIEAQGTRTFLAFLKNHQTNYHRNLFDLADYLRKNRSVDHIVVGWGWPKLPDQNYDISLYCQAPEKKFRFVYNSKDRVETRLFSESTRPSGEVTVLIVPHPGRETPDPRGWHPAVQNWFRQKGPPLLRFAGNGPGLTLEVYEGRFDESIWPPDLAPVPPRWFLL